jgi:hypothetical protein
MWKIRKYYTFHPTILDAAQLSRMENLIRRKSMTQTQSDLPELNDDFQLSHKQIGSFQQNGHAIVRGLASPAEVAAYRPAIAETLFQHKFENRPFEERDTFGKAFLQAENLWEKSEAGRYFVFARRFARVAAQLMGVPAVRCITTISCSKKPVAAQLPGIRINITGPSAAITC